MDNMLTTSATTLQRYRYSSYGKTTLEKDNGSTDHSFIENLFAYTGREYDIDTELYSYRSRYFSPEIGRFLSEDRLGFAGGDTNLYRYVGNNPISRRDPNGMFWLNIAGAISGAIGAAIGDIAAHHDVSAQNVITGAALGFIFPNAGVVLSTALGFFSSSINPDPAGPGSDKPRVPLPPEIQNLIKQNPVSTVPTLNPFAGQTQLSPRNSCGG